MLEEYKKPKAIVLKILGVCCPFSFAKIKLINYSIENCKKFIDKHILDKNIIDLLPKLQKFYSNFAIEHQNFPIIPFDLF